MAAQSTQQPTLDDVMRELKDIKNQLAKSKESFNKALWLTPMAFGGALVAMGFHNDVVFWVVGALAILLAILGMRGML